MEKPRSYAVFEDEHEEDLLYFEENKSGGTIFATKSGIYRFCPFTSRIDDGKYMNLCSHFERVGPDSSILTDEIKYVVVDNRIPYEFKVEKGASGFCGQILVPPDATDEEIRKLIVNEMDIRYKKVSTKKE